MIEIKDKKDCCGCWSCANICPKHCIEMVEDEEGFRYPQVDQTLCVDCGLCEKACPVINYKEQPLKKERLFLVQHRDLNILKESTSGGAFSVLGESIIKQGGVVFGAVYDDQFTVKHDFIDGIEDLRKFRNSKYVQSSLQGCFYKVKSLLKEGRKVLFSGTPCQVEGLLNYVGNKFENLLTVDFVCHAIPSPKFFKRYISYLGEEDKIVDIKFRYKEYGYKYSTMRVEWFNNKVYSEGIDSDIFLRAFFENMSIRPCCSQCKFRHSLNRRSDFTLWDCFEISEINKKLDNDKGVTRVLCHTERSADLLLGNNDIAQIIEIPYNQTYNEGEKKWIINLNPKRDAFFSDLNNPQISDKIFFNRYYPITWKTILEKKLRMLLNVTGLYRLAKKIQRKLNKK